MIVKPIEGGSEGRPGEHVCGLSDDPSNHIICIITEVLYKGLVNIDFQLQPVQKYILNIFVLCIKHVQK